VEAAEYLSSITGLDIAALSADMQAAASQAAHLSAEELLSADLKEYEEKGATFAVSQVETDSPMAIVDRRAEIIAAMEEARAARKHLFVALLVTDVTLLDSLLFVTGERGFVDRINFPLATDGIYELVGVVSRKKQLAPLLAELVARHAEAEGRASG